MSLILRRDAKQNIVLYRERTGDAVRMTIDELCYLACVVNSFCGSDAEPLAVEFGAAGWKDTPQEFHRRIYVHKKRTMIGSLQLDMFDVRKPECC